MDEKLSLSRNLIATINSYYSRYVTILKSEEEKQWETALIYKGLDIYLKFLDTDFKKKFMSEIDPRILKAHVHLKQLEKDHSNVENMKKEVDQFTNNLAKNDDLKIFIGKDAYYPYEEYKKKYFKRNDSVFLKYSRPYLFNYSNGIGYFTLVHNIYKSYFPGSTMENFFNEYKTNLKSNRLFYSLIREKTIQLLKRTRAYEKIKKSSSVKIIDSGTQAGLILPLMTVLDEEGIKTDFALLSSFNWIHPLFKGKVHTKDLFIFLLVEHEGTKRYFESKKR